MMTLTINIADMNIFIQAPPKLLFIDNIISTKPHIVNIKLLFCLDDLKMIIDKKPQGCFTTLGFL